MKPAWFQAGTSLHRRAEMALRATRPGFVSVAACLLVAACTSMPSARAPAAIYTGQIDVYLEPFDDKRSCSITIGLRNSSGVRQGDANLRLDWLDSSGALIAGQSVGMDGLLDGRYDAKNLALPVRCREVGKLVVRRAEWDLFDGWASTSRPVVRIDGVEGTEWRMAWDEATGLFVGQREGG